MTGTCVAKWFDPPPKNHTCEETNGCQPGCDGGLPDATVPFDALVVDQLIPIDATSPPDLVVVVDLLAPVDATRPPDHAGLFDLLAPIDATRAPDTAVVVDLLAPVDATSAPVDASVLDQWSPADAVVLDLRAPIDAAERDSTAPIDVGELYTALATPGCGCALGAGRPPPEWRLWAAIAVLAFAYLGRPRRRRR